MRHSTILLLSIPLLLLFSQALSSNRFLQNRDDNDALNRPFNGSAPHDGNYSQGHLPHNDSNNASLPHHPEDHGRPEDRPHHLPGNNSSSNNNSRLLQANESAPRNASRDHEHGPQNDSNNASFPHHPEGHVRPEDRPNHPSGNHSNWNNGSAPQPANNSRLLQANESAPRNASRDHEHGPHNESYNASLPHHPEGHGRPEDRLDYPPGNHSNWNNGSAPQSANNSRLLPANQSLAGEGRNATHAIRPRGSAPSWNETRGDRGRGRRGHIGNGTHAFGGENGEEAFHAWNSTNRA